MQNPQSYAIAPHAPRPFWTSPRREAGWAYGFIGLWFIGFILFTLGPMVASLYFSFTDYNVVDPPRWVGLANYRALLSDQLFWHSLQVTFWYAILSLPLTLVVSFLLAVLLNQRLPGIRIWRTLYFLPSVMPGVAVALLWLNIFHPTGLFNQFLVLFGIKGPGWLQDPNWAVPALALMALWGAGGGVIVYLAGLQGIPTDLYDAAAVDGVNFWQRFRYVTLPMMSPVIFYNLVMGLIGTFQFFTEAYVVSGGKGGPRRRTLFYNLYLYQNAFAYFHMGTASAMAWVLFVLVLLLTVLVFRSSTGWVHYEGQLRGRS